MSDTQTGLELLQEAWGYHPLADKGELMLYMKALLVVAGEDGLIDRAERDWVVTYAFDQGLDDAALEELRAYRGGDELAALLAQMDPTALPDELLAVRRALLFDAMRAAAADGVFAAEERAAVRRVAGRMGITGADIDALEARFSDRDSAR